MHLVKIYYTAACRIVVSLLFLCAFASTARAENKPAAKEDKKLQQLFAALKNADGYTYQISVQNSIAGDTHKTAAQKRLNYVSKSAFIIYSKSDNELFFLCDKGQFNVDEAKKTVSYSTFDNDSLLQHMKEYYAVQMAGVMDSVFLARASVAQKKNKGKNIWYRLSYPEGSVVTAFSILARQSDAVPEKVEYTTSQLSNFNPNSIRICQYFTMDHYKHSMPGEVNALLKEAQDLAQYLHKHYNGYTIQKL